MSSALNIEILRNNLQHLGHYAEVLKNARKSAGITQQQLADKIGKKREYIAMLEKGETDMQLSTFIMISEAVGLKFALTY